MLYNCATDDDPLEIWVNDFTAGSGWADEGTLQPGWEDGGCGETPEDSWQLAPVSGHDYEVRSVDFDADGCSNDPTISSCTASDTTFVGGSNGGVMTVPIGYSPLNVWGRHVRSEQVPACPAPCQVQRAK